MKEKLEAAQTDGELQSLLSEVDSMTVGVEDPSSIDTGIVPAAAATV